MLHKSIQNQRIHHALLFQGPAGTGKFPAALQVARHLNCQGAAQDGLDSCRYCRRVSPPFPFHPDLMILRPADAPLVLHESLFSSAEPDEHIKKGNADSGEKLQQIESVLKNDPFIRDIAHRGNVFVLRLKTGKIAGKNQNRNSGDPILDYLQRKIESYHSSVMYENIIKIDAVRNMQKFLSLQPFEAKTKVVIIDGADAMRSEAQNCLLKTLEEPPAHSILILTTSNSSALLPTIRSRCQPVPFHRLKPDEIRTLLSDQFGFSLQDADRISRHADGRMDRALFTDWSAFQHRRNRFESIFSGGHSVLVGEWAVRSTRILIDEAEKAEDNNIFSILNEFYHWLHDELLLLNDPDDAHRNYFLPRNEPLKIPAIIFLMDMLTDLQKKKMFHSDIQLQLEKIFIETFRMRSGI